MGNSVQTWGEPPEWLSEIARREYPRIGASLELQGIFVPSSLLAIYCQAFGRSIEAGRMMEETGGPVITDSNGDRVINPWHEVMMSASEVLYGIATDCGMTPLSRQLILRKRQAGRYEEDDE